MVAEEPIPGTPQNQTRKPGRWCSEDYNSWLVGADAIRATVDAFCLRWRQATLGKKVATCMASQIWKVGWRRLVEQHQQPTSITATTTCKPQHKAGRLLYPHLQLRHGAGITMVPMGLWSIDQQCQQAIRQEGPHSN